MSRERQKAVCLSIGCYTTYINSVDRGYAPPLRRIRPADGASTSIIPEPAPKVQMSCPGHGEADPPTHLHRPCVTPLPCQKKGVINDLTTIALTGIECCLIYHLYFSLPGTGGGVCERRLLFGNTR
jgi:hypothetical protein